MKQVRVVIKFMGTVVQTLAFPLLPKELVGLRLLSQLPPIEKDQRPDFIYDPKGLKQDDLGRLLSEQIEHKPEKIEFDQYSHRVVDRDYGEQVLHLQGPVKVITIDIHVDGGFNINVAEEAPTT